MQRHVKSPYLSAGDARFIRPAPFQHCEGGEVSEWLPPHPWTAPSTVRKDLGTFTPYSKVDRLTQQIVPPDSC